jgi:hypothetical protein
LFWLVACIMTPLALYAGLEATTCSLKRLQVRDYRSDLIFFARFLRVSEHPRLAYNA